MSPFLRWIRFNLVGALGMAVQLAALALFTRLLHGHALVASAAAVELTLVHNFCLHRRYTWRDRRGGSARWGRAFLRFQLANGMVSLVGNLLLMRLLLHTAHLPLLLANAIAILACSLVNFALSHGWAFRDPGRAAPRMEARRAIPALCLTAMLLPAALHAQSQTQPANASDSAPLPEAPVPRGQSAPTSPIEKKASPAQLANYYAGVFCGLGTSTSSRGSLPAAGCGAGITFLPLPLFVEVGVMGPQANRSYISGYLSVDANIPLARISTLYLPLALIGYSRLFETGHALDFGLALNLPTRDGPGNASMRVELRDYYTFANPAQHNVMLRVGWISPVSD